MQVTIYSTTTCPFCQSLKKYLEEKNIPFKEKMVDSDDAAREEMIKESGGFLGIPFVVIVKDDNSKETVIGFDKGRINSILGIQE